MASNTEVKETKEDIKVAKTSMKCVLCNDNLKSPKLLPCHHSCCTACLRHRLTKNEEGTEISCPICGFVVQLGKIGIEMLPSNVLADILDEYYGKKIKNSMCSSCAVVNKEEISTHRCLDCGDTFCKTCSEFHCRPLSLRHHLVVPLEETVTKASREEFKARKTKSCGIHSSSGVQVLKTSYCKSCKVLVCIQCIIQSHTGHSFVEIQEISKTQKALLLKRAKGDVSKRKQIVESAMSMLDSKEKEQEDYIFDKATELYELIETIKQEKLTAIKEHYKEEKKLLQDILERETMTQKTLESTFNFVQDFVEFSTNVDFLQNVQAIISQLDTIQIQAEKNFSVCSLKIDNNNTHLVKEELKKVFGSICKVEHTKKFKIKVRESVVSSSEQSSNSKGLVFLGGQATTCENKCLALRTSNGQSFIERFDTFKQEILFLKYMASSSSSSPPLPREFKKPSDIHVRGKNTYISDIGKTEMKVAVLENGKDLLRTYTLPEWENENTYIGVCVNSKEEIFISTQSNIYKCTPNDILPIVYLDVPNEKASQKVFICMTPNDELVVSGHGSKVPVYNSTGKLVSEYDSAELGIETTGRVTCDNDSYIYIADSKLDMIMVVRDGKREGVIDTKALLQRDRHFSSFTIAKDKLLLSMENTVTRYKIWDYLF